jgi:predicted GH43/DUF377 family glycosyl hydrolase
VIYSTEAPPEERFRMWYSGKRGDLYEGFGLATSPDGRQWRREGRVLALGGPGEWDSAEIVDPSVIVVDGGYRMYYCGARAAGRAYSAGVALSVDGRNWTKLPENPLYPLEGEETSIYTVDVIRHGDGRGGFVLFASQPDADESYEVHAVHSDDGIHWDLSTRYIVLAPSRDNTWDHKVVYGMDVVPYGEQLYMWFNGMYSHGLTRGGQVGLARVSAFSLDQLLSRNDR